LNNDHYIATIGDKFKLRLLRGLAATLKLPFARGRITISEAAYRLLKPDYSLVTMMVGDYPITVDLSQPELRYIYFGAFEQSECRFLRQYLRKDDIVADVGANVGYSSAIILGEIGKRGRLYAFEPNPQVYKFLQPLEKASSGVMKAFQLAVCAQTSGTNGGQVKLFINSQHSMWSSTIEDFAGTKNPNILLIDTISLSDFFKKIALKRFAL
jgi:FkbM family methyltransferase